MRMTDYPQLPQLQQLLLALRSGWDGLGKATTSFLQLGPIHKRQ